MAFRGHDQAVQIRTGRSALGCVVKQKILAGDGKRANGVFRHLVAHRQMTGLTVKPQLLSELVGIVQRFAKFRFRRGFSGRAVLHSPRTSAGHVLQPKHGLARIAACLSSSLVMPHQNWEYADGSALSIAYACFADNGGDKHLKKLLIIN